MKGHTLNQVTVCGGVFENIRNVSSNCLQLQGNNWNNIVSLRTPRAYHVSMPRHDGIQLLGGYAGTRIIPGTDYAESRRLRSTENVVNGKFSSGILLNRRISSACAVELDNRIVLTGGRDYATWVTAYDEEGNIEELAQMRTGRHDHGCGVVDMAGEQVMIVAGGIGRIGCGHLEMCRIRPIDSVEMYRSRTGMWSPVESLPSRTAGLRGVVLGGDLYMVGGCTKFPNLSVFSSSEWHSGSNPTACEGSVLRYNAEAEMWEQQRDLGVGSGYHALSVVPFKDIRQYCTV